MQIKLVQSVEELKGIILLQKANLRKNLSLEKAAIEGFLTAEYDLSYLQELHAAHPSVIAVENDNVIGYALVALKEVGLKHDLLADLINTIDSLNYKGVSLKQANYVLVGQLCVAEGFRGQGVVQKLYNGFKDALKTKFEYCLTDVAEDNPRSLKAHLNAGFKVIDRLNYGGIGWSVVLWDWINEL
ncbi:MAG TPA: GNAT family N-acetyltransferase [Cytophagaceae bacterium]|jgi:predicted GNAT superfamily acetyltransferase